MVKVIERKAKKNYAVEVRSFGELSPYLKTLIYVVLNYEEGEVIDLFKVELQKIMSGNSFYDKYDALFSLYVLARESYLEIDGNNNYQVPVPWFLKPNGKSKEAFYTDLLRSKSKGTYILDALLLKNKKLREIHKKVEKEEVVLSKAGFYEIISTKKNFLDKILVDFAAEAVVKIEPR